MQDSHAASVEQLLGECESGLVFLTPRDRAGAWKLAFGDAAPRVPRPYWLYGEDEQHAVVLGFPLRVSPGWEAFRRSLIRLVEAECAYRTSLAIGEPASKTALLEQRANVANHLAELLENAYLHDHGRLLPEILWLAISREMADAVGGCTRALVPQSPKLPGPALEQMRYTIAQRLGDLSHRAETEAVARIRRSGLAEPTAEELSFARMLRADLLPLAENRIRPDLKELDAYLQGYLRVDAARFHRLIDSTSSQLDALRQHDPAFNRVLALLDEEGAKLSSDRLLFNPAALDLLAAWGHPDAPHLSTDLVTLLRELAARLKRFEVIGALRGRLQAVTVRGTRVETRLNRQVVRLSSSTRPIDFTTPGVVDSMVRRFGLVYDLVEFTQILEEIRRQGRGAEENGLRMMVRFQAQAEEIRARHRLKFEKFLGDGAFYSARSARACLLAAAEFRILYERLRHQGFPFDRGLRLALSVGTYHLLAMPAGDAGRPHFEFFGHGLVELARLTTGKTTHEVEDIADFLMSAGYDVHRVLAFLEPVRQASRFSAQIQDRPYAAFLAENGELVNLGGVVTEAFLGDLESEWNGPLGAAESCGLRWLAIPTDPERPQGPWIGLRSLGTARLKGLDPMPLAEMVVFDRPPDGVRMLPESSPLLHSLRELSGERERTGEQVLASMVDADTRLCVVSALDGPGERVWYIGDYSDEIDSLENGFRIPLALNDLQDGEPFEAWLFRRRGELAMLYQGLRRDAAGQTFPLERLRATDGYFTCLLSAPHRSPR